MMEGYLQLPEANHVRQTIAMTPAKFRQAGFRAIDKLVARYVGGDAVRTSI